MRLAIRLSRCQPLRDLGPGWGALNSSKSSGEPGETMEKRRARSESIRKILFWGYGGLSPGNRLEMGKG